MNQTISISHDDLLAVVGELERLSRWLRPGTLSFQFGRLKAALMPAARSVNDELEAMREEAAEKDADGKPKMVEVKHPVTNAVLGQRYEFRDQQEHLKREREFLAEITTLELPFYLDEAKHIKPIEKELRANTDGLESPDFGRLVLLMKA